MILLTALNAFFSASEMALISLNDNKIKMMADDGDKKAKKLVRLLAEPGRFLSTIQIGITLVGFLASAFAAETFADPIVGLMKMLGWTGGEDVLRVLTVVVITILLSYFTLVLGELVPKRIAMKKSEGIAFFVVTPLMVLSKAMRPFLRLVMLSTNFFVRLFGIDPSDEEDDVTEEEIRMLIDVGEEKGTIYESEKIMINNIFEFNNKIATDIMIHRMDMVSIPIDMELPQIIEIIEKEKYTRIPVYEQSIDNVIGILHVKDLVSLMNEDCMKQFKLKDTIRRPFFIPTSKKIDELFVDLKRARTHMAIVIDEYGGTAGIVTIEDLLEEIVGSIVDEYDQEEIEIREIDKNTYEISGMISLDEIEKFFEIEFPIDEYETLSGFIISLIGRIPLKEEVIEVKYGNFRIEVIEVTDKRIEKVRFHIDEKNKP
ncbi:MAG: hemolysin family protein [Proteocatella sp.]